MMIIIFSLVEFININININKIVYYYYFTFNNTVNKSSIINNNISTN